MPEGCYTDYDYQWGYDSSEEQGAVLFGAHTDSEP